MLKLALCEDEAIQRDIASMLLNEYLKDRPERPGKVFAFSSGPALLEALKTEGRFDLYLLDVMMPEMSGIDLGLKLRQQDGEAVIIYLTVSPEYAISAYETQAFGYLVKPVERDRLYQVLDRAIGRMEKRKGTCVSVKTRSGLQRISLDDILYVELADRAMRYHLSDGEQVDSVTLRGAFQAAAAPMLEDPRFLLCGASFVVNLYYVAAVEKGLLRLSTGERVPLPRGSASEARRRWQAYWFPNGESPRT